MTSFDNGLVLGTQPFIPPKALLEQPGQFASALAHEVRNPLSNINLAIELLRSSVMDKEQRLYLDIITRGSGRINEVVVDLLTYFRADETQAEKHSVHQLLDEVLTATSDRIMMKNTNVVKKYAEADYKVFVNRQQVKMAFTNIIINAIEAMSPDNAQLTVSTGSDNNQCIIEITDNGSGISKEDIETLFQPYVTHKKLGIGLGLSTTKNILASHHATIDVRSEEGKGSSFILSFEMVS